MRSSASSFCTLGCSSALAQPHGRSIFLGTNRREGVTNSGLHGAQKGLRVGAARGGSGGRRKAWGLGVWEAAGSVSRRCCEFQLEEERIVAVRQPSIPLLRIPAVQLLPQNRASLGYYSLISLQCLTIYSIFVGGSQPSPAFRRCFFFR